MHGFSYAVALRYQVAWGTFALLCFEHFLTIVEASISYIAKADGALIGLTIL